MQTSKIGLHDLDPSLIEALSKISSSSGGGKLEMYTYSITAETEGQTEFAIPMETFDVSNDTVLVQSGIVMMFPGEDFVVEGNKVVLTEGVSVGRTIGIYVMRNVVLTDEETMISGTMIEEGSIPLDRLAEEIPVPDVSGQINTHNTAEDAHDGVLAKADHNHDDKYAEAGHAHDGYAPMYDYSTTDIGAGSSLETGKLYLVYED